MSTYYQVHSSEEWPKKLRTSTSWRLEHIIKGVAYVGETCIIWAILGENLSVLLHRHFKGPSIHIPRTSVDNSSTPTFSTNVLVDYSNVMNIWSITINVIKVPTERDHFVEQTNTKCSIFSYTLHLLCCFTELSSIILLFWYFITFL